MSGLLPLLTEDVVDLITDHLKANFNAVLKTADFKYPNTGISLTGIDSNHYYISDVIEPLDLPSCFVLFGQHAFEYADGQNYLISADSVLVVVTVEEIGAEGATRKAYRYGRALFGTLNLVKLVTPDDRMEIVLIPRNLGYTQPITSKLSQQKGKYRKDVVLELELKHFEKNEF